jgi:peptidoglycan hydrolase-like protein with peptidoglycan-binding domain
MWVTQKELNVIDPRTLQTWLKEYKVYDGPIDGLIGPKSRAAIDQVVGQLSDSVIAGWDNARKFRAIEQIFLEAQGFDVGEIDGLYGPGTEAAHDAWITLQRDSEPAEPVEPPVPIAPPTSLIRNTWPRQKDVPAFYGDRGENQVLVAVPYKIYFGNELVKRISLHEKVAASAGRVFAAVLAEYGEQRIKELGLNLYSGSLNVRKMRGGSAWSMHSWGIAIDWNAALNSLKMDHTLALFARPEYVRFWEIWEAEGWLSLGRARDFDWMHIQAARL